MRSGSMSTLPLRCRFQAVILVSKRAGGVNACCQLCVTVPQMQALLGSTGSDPKWAVALKLAAQAAETRLLDIELSLGRSGVAPIGHITVCIVPWLPSLKYHACSCEGYIASQLGDSALADRTYALT